MSPSIRQDKRTTALLKRCPNVRDNLLCASEIGDEMGRDDLANLLPWFKQKYVTLWPEVEYVEITAAGLKVQQSDKRKYVLTGKNIVNTQDWAANVALVEQLKPLVGEIAVAGSAREPGLMADAVREGVAAGCAV